jgi:hypothetical protein
VETAPHDAETDLSAERTSATDFLARNRRQRRQTLRPRTCVIVTAFWLDRDPDRTARWSVDSHVLSSVSENAAVLTTAVQLNDCAEGDPTASENLSFTHADHPLTRWAAADPDN